MDSSIIIGVVGVVATLVFGFLSIDLFKRKRYPGKVTYVKLSLIDLLNNVANNFEEIKLLHDDSPINKNLMYIKGALINNGDIDINSTSTEKDITIELPENCTWLDVKPTHHSKGLSVSINKETGREAAFHFDLFRKNEFVQFEGLIESDQNYMSSDMLESELVFTHRIENTSKIEKKSLLSERQIKRKKRKALSYSLAILAFLILFSLTFILNIFGAKSETLYFERIGATTEEIFKVKLEENSVHLSPMYNGSEDLYISTEKFNRYYKASPKKLTFWQKFKDQYWILSLQLAFFAILVLWELLEIRGARKLSNIMST